ncbi:MAG: thioredoxin family protein [Chitinophagaceae bacterium]|nr:MAG: thioredoxin family protein [Chitinophagaceae bacterium]
MKKLLLSALLLTGITAFSQDLKNFRLYSPDADAAKGIDAAVAKAKASGRNVFLQVGGNWCIWCMRFNDFTTKDPQIDSLVNANYVVYHLNYSKENTNEKILAKYRFPQRFGFPVFLVLDGNGQLLHTQNSALLEDEKTKSYSRDNVIGFFRDWSPAALDPATYKE